MIISLKETDCDAKSVGRLHLTLALLIAAAAIPVYVSEVADGLLLWLFALVAVYFAAHGAYLLLIRRKPVKHSLLLGGPTARLYNRFGVWTVPIATVYNSILSTSVLCGVMVLGNKLNTTSRSFNIILYFAPLLVIKGLQTSVMDYIALRKHHREAAEI